MAKIRDIFRARSPTESKRNQSGVVVCDGDDWQKLFRSGYKSVADCAEVRTCVHKYADLISSMTIYQMEHQDGLGDTRIVDGLSRVIDIEPNKYMTRKQFIYAIVHALLLEGNGNAVVLPKLRGEYLTSLELLEPNRVSFVDTLDGGYTINYNGKAYQPDEVLHFTIRPNPNRPWVGTGIEISAQDLVGSLTQARKTKKALMASPKPSIVIAFDGLTADYDTEDGYQRIKKRLVRETEDGTPWLIPNEIAKVSTVKPLSLNDLAIKDSVEMDLKSIAALFGVPPFMVGVGAYNKDEYNNFLATCVMPMAQSITQELTRKIIYGTSRYFKFNLRSLYDYSVSDITSIGGAMVDRIAMDRNEWRDWMGMSPREDMKELLALENYIPADKLGEQKKLVEEIDVKEEGGGAN
jgi:HK97 family phage portal protein